MAYLLVIVGGVLLLTLALNPKIGAVLLFPVVFLYPHVYMQRQEFLPWNIGVDDLFICVLFLVVLVRRNLLGGVSIRWGLSLGGVTAYLVIWSIANLSGWYLLPELEPVDVYKPILKSVIYVLYVYSLVHSIDDKRDLLRIATVFAVVLTVASFFVILHKLWPDSMRAFASENPDQVRGWVDRAVGPFLNANVGAALMSMLTVFVLPLIIARPPGAVKLVLWAALPVTLGAMALTESRSGVLALVFTVGVMCVAARSRRYAVAISVLMMGAVLVRPQMLMGLWERLQDIYTPLAGGMLAENAEGRIWVWQELWRTSSPQVWLLGQGRTVPMVTLGFDAHNSYVGALFIHGLGGVIWALWFFGTIVRRGTAVVRTGIEPQRSVAAAVLWAMLVFAVASLTIDLMVTQMSQFVYFFFAVLVERAHALASPVGAPGGAGARDVFLRPAPDRGRRARRHARAVTASI